MKRMGKSGFTLVELLVVIAILALLAGIGVPQVMRTLQRSREVADLAAIDSVQSAVNAWRAETGAYWWQANSVHVNTPPADGGGKPSTVPDDYVEITKAVEKHSLITENPVKLEALLEGGDFPSLKSITLTGSETLKWYLTKDGDVRVAKTAGTWLLP